MSRFKVNFEIVVVCNSKGFQRVRDISDSPIDKKKIFEGFVNELMEYENWHSISVDIGSHKIAEF